MQHPAGTSGSLRMRPDSSNTPNPPSVAPIQTNGAMTSAQIVNLVDTPPPLRGNPFRYVHRMDTYEVLKTIGSCLLLLPLLRLALLLATVLVITLVSLVATIGYTLVDPETKARNPLSGWRQWVASPVPFLIRILLFALGYHWISIKLPPGGLDRKTLPRIIVANHIGFVDGVFFAYYLRTSIAMKAELAQIPIAWRVIATTQPILIDRKSSDGRRRALQDINEHLASPTYPPLLIFPEGTTSSQDYLTKFKVGSFASGLPCLPVVLKYPFKHMDVSWTPDISALYLLARLLCQFHNRMEVEFVSPYHPSDQEKQQPAVYAENVRQLMAQTLHVQCTNHAFEDVALLLQVGQYVDQHVIPVTDVGEVVSLTALQSGDVGKLVEYFMKHDLNHDGQISLEELTQLFPSDDPDFLDRLFHLLDLDGSGQIDFRELCMGLAALNPRRDEESLMKFAFQLYDVDGNGVIDKTELVRMVEFMTSFYGATTSESANLELELLALNSQEPISIERFQDLVRRHPALLGHAKSKLEMLRGSFSLVEA